MATSASPQRAWRAACPNCGAPVDFRSAASASAVCSYCRSTLVREGDALRRIGQSAELFDDHTPLRLGASGRLQGEAFTLVGRLQNAYADGTWNEWHALFDNGRSGWLSEDNGAYVFGFDAPAPDAVPAEGSVRAGARMVLEGQAWDVASVVQARVVAAEGELPVPPALGREREVVDLRSTQGEVATLDRADAGRLQWAIGRSVLLPALAMSGLADASEKTLAGRTLPCPNCGAPLEPRLDSTKSVVCGQCRSVVDLSQGVGADLAYYAQGQPQIDGGQPQIPLGTTGPLAFGTAIALPWQVVGYVERAQRVDDESFFWREYLLYNRQHGFVFLVDAEDGWSWVRPITGVPQRAGSDMQLGGVRYRRADHYEAVVTWVMGEFYWVLKRNERSANTDYHGVPPAGHKRLNREQTGNEVTWSAGETLDAQVVARAFALAPQQAAALRRDARPGSALAGWSGGLGKAALLLAMVVVVAIVAARCSSERDCSDVRATFGESSNEYRECQRTAGSGGGVRTGGGSFGGYSSGGGHK